MTLGAPIPILRMFDVEKARAFYLGFLEFNVVFEHRFDADAPLYLAIARGDCIIHLSEHHGDACPGAAVRVATTDIDQLHRTLMAKNYVFGRPRIEEMPWGMRELRVTDPFGNKLVFFAST